MSRVSQAGRCGRILRVGIEQQLQQLLRNAMRERDSAVMAAARAALAAIANAESVTPPESAPTTSAHIAGAVLGAGAAEAQRAVLDEPARRDLVAQEAAELTAHAQRLREQSRVADAEAAERGAAALLNIE